jgi:hypothetical protein
MKQMDEYSGPFPIINIGGTQFHVNAYLEELTEVANPENRINVMDMTILEDHLELWYDARSKNAYQGAHYGEIPDEVTLYWLYPLATLDPLGANAWMDGQSPGWRKEYPQALPIIDIGGKAFLVDALRNAFRDPENCWNQIGFSDVVFKEGVTGVYIDKRSHKIPLLPDFNPYEHSAEIPDNVFFAPVPDGRQLADIIKAYENARAENHNTDELLRRAGRR